MEGHYDKDQNEGLDSVAVTLTVNGQEVTRRFHVADVADIDWNDAINDMVGSITQSV